MLLLLLSRHEAGLESKGSDMCVQSFCWQSVVEIILIVSSLVSTLSAQSV